MLPKHRIMGGLMSLHPASSGLSNPNEWVLVSSVVEVKNSTSTMPCYLTYVLYVAQPTLSLNSVKDMKGVTLHFCVESSNLCARQWFNIKTLLLSFNLNII